jgi:hypothetical protein
VSVRTRPTSGPHPKAPTGVRRAALRLLDDARKRLAEEDEERAGDFRGYDALSGKGIKR